MARSRQGDIENIIDLIYDAAVSAVSWEQVLSDIGEAIGATSAAAIWVEQGGQRLAQANLWSMDPALMQEYARTYLPICPRMRIGRGLASGDVFSDRSARQLTGPMAREYYAFMDRNDSGLARVVVAERNADLDIGISFYGRISDADDQNDLSLLKRLAPHLRRAAVLRHQVGALESRSAFAVALQASASPAAIVSRAGRVLFANPAAEAILSRQDGLFLQRGMIAANSLTEEKKLYSALSVAFQSGNVSETANAAILRRRSGSPLAVSFTRLAESANSFSGEPVAVMRLAELAPRVPTATLQQMFGLSRAEAEVALAISRGASVEEVAESRATSILTTRTQVKAILAKMDVKSQVQLAATVTALSGLYGS